MIDRMMVNGAIEILLREDVKNWIEPARLIVEAETVLDGNIEHSWSISERNTDDQEITGYAEGYGNVSTGNKEEPTIHESSNHSSQRIGYYRLTRSGRIHLSVASVPTLLSSIAIEYWKESGAFEDEEVANHHELLYDNETKAPILFVEAIARSRPATILERISVIPKMIQAGIQSNRFWKILHTVFSPSSEYTFTAFSFRVIYSSCAKIEVGTILPTSMSAMRLTR